MAAQTSPEHESRAAPGGDQQIEGAGSAGITADDLRQIVRALGLVEIPDHLMPKVLDHVRSHRESMRKFDAAGIDLAGVVTAQPYRA